MSADRPFWLEAFKGDADSGMRKGQDARNEMLAPVVIPHLSIGVIGSVQLDPLRQFLATRTPVSTATIDLLEAYGQEMFEKTETASAWYASTLDSIPGLTRGPTPR